VEDEPTATILSESPALSRAAARGRSAPKERLRFAARQFSASDGLVGACAGALHEAGGPVRAMHARQHVLDRGSLTFMAKPELRCLAAPNK
jgi:hypothetical protein